MTVKALSLEFLAARRPAQVCLHACRSSSHNLVPGVGFGWPSAELVHPIQALNVTWCSCSVYVSV